MIIFSIHHLLHTEIQFTDIANSHGCALLLDFKYSPHTHSLLVVRDIVDKKCVFISYICFLGHNTSITQHCNFIDLTEVVFLTNLIW